MKLHDELRCDECGEHPFHVVQVDEDEADRYTICRCGQPVLKVALVSDRTWDGPFEATFDLRYCCVPKRVGGAS